MTTIIADQVDQFVNLIPLNSLIATDEDRTIFKFGVKGAEDTIISRKKRNLYKKYDLSLWLPTVQRLEAGYTHPTIQAKQSKGGLGVGRTHTKNKKNQTDLTARPSLEELRERLAAKREALKVKPKVKKGIQTKSKAPKTPKTQSTKPPTNEPEIENEENIDFGSFVFAKTIGETATKLSQQNKKGTKLKRIRQGISELKKNEKIVSNLKGKEKIEAEHKQAMKRALQKVQGKKVVDNIKTLKKSERSIKNKKQKSIKKWTAKKKK